MLERVHADARRHAIVARSASRSRSREGIVIDATDMSTPVTRGELREELMQLEVRLEERLERKLEEKLERKLEEKLERKLEEKLERKLEEKLERKLEVWGGALLARIESSEQRLLAELARHTRAIYESMSTQITIIDEKYADLPERVSRLEVMMAALKMS